RLRRRIGCRYGEGRRRTDPALTLFVAISGIRALKSGGVRQKEKAPPSLKDRTCQTRINAHQPVDLTFELGDLPLALDLSNRGIDPRHRLPYFRPSFSTRHKYLIVSIANPNRCAASLGHNIKCGRKSASSSPPRSRPLLAGGDARGAANSARIASNSRM